MWGQLFNAVPTFPLCMLGGMIVQLIFMKCKIAHLIDRQSIERLQGLALEILVASAIASISIPVLIQYALPFSILMVVGIAYIVSVTWFIAPRMLSGAWFENRLLSLECKQVLQLWA